MSPRPPTRGARVAALALLAVLVPGGLGGSAAAQSDATWVDAWQAAPQGPYPAGCGGPFPSRTLFPLDEAVGQSFRMVVRPSLGGTAVRVRLSNLYGSRTLTLGRTTLARRSGTGPGIDTGSLRELRFGGAAEVKIPAGAEVLSDAVALSVPALAELVVSTHVKGAGGAITWHADGLTTSYVTRTGNGDRTTDASGASYSDTTASYFYLTGVQVLHPGRGTAVVALGDSITDGAGATRDADNRWLDVLGDRLRAEGRDLATINAGISCNNLTSGSSDGGASGEARFARDVLDRQGVAYAIVLHGSNDVATGQSAATITGALSRLADAARARGVRVLGGTLLPRSGDITPAREAVRRQVNDWIRTTPAFAGVIDFDAALRSASDPGRMAAVYDLDGVHPNAAGHAAMGRAVDLALLSARQTLTVTRSGSLDPLDRVTSAPAGIDCGVICTSEFDHGQTVTLSAAPGPGRIFTGWSGAGCSGTGSCVVPIGGAVTVDAGFAAARRLTVAVEPSGAGSVSGPGISCPGDCTEDVADGRRVTLTATAATGSAFTGWSGADCMGATCEVTMDQARSVTAQFVALRTLTVGPGGDGAGSITSVPAGIACGADCTEAYRQGTTVTLTATPSVGSEFTGWTGPCTGTGDCTVSMAKAELVGATFRLKTHPLTILLGGRGRGRVASSRGGLDCGPICLADLGNLTAVTLTATAEPGSRFTGWEGAGCSGTGECEITMDDAKSVTAFFEPVEATAPEAGSSQGAPQPAGIPHAPAPLLPAAPTSLGAAVAGTVMGSAPDTVGTPLQLVSSSLRVRDKRVAVEVLCPLREPNACRGTVRLVKVSTKRGRRVELTLGTASLPRQVPGARRIVRVPLRNAAIRQIPKGDAISVVVRLESFDDLGNRALSEPAARLRR